MTPARTGKGACDAAIAFANRDDPRAYGEGHECR